MPKVERSYPLSQREVDEVQSILDDIGRFLKMEWHAYVAHVKAHPADKLCSIPNPLGYGHLNCSREAVETFERLASAAIASQPDRFDFDHGQVVRQLERDLGQYFLVNRRLDDEAVGEMLVSTLTHVAAKHRRRTHWLPCILFETKHTDDFQVGPVRFLTREKFLAEHQPHFEKEREKERSVTLGAVRDESKRSQLPYKTEAEAIELADKIVAAVTDYFDGYPWVAEVSVPSCAHKVSTARANSAVQGALDVLKIHFGSRAERIRIGHERGAPRKTASWSRDDDANEFGHGYSRGAEGIVVQDTWMADVIEPNRFYFDAAALTLSGDLDPTSQRELALRFRDAMFWYGEAVSERVMSAQIVKFAACLERLTITSDQHAGLGKTAVSRIGYLCGGSVEGERQKRRDAKQVYDFRSELMHGKISPFEPQLRSVAVTAHRLARACLFSFIHVCWWLQEEGMTATDASLEAFYTRELRRPPQTVNGVESESET